MSAKARSNRGAIKYGIIAVVLIALLALLGYGYWQLTKPQRLATDGGNRDRNFLFSIYGFEGDLLRRPSSVDIASNGDIHVADTGKRRIVVFDQRGNFVTTYGEYGGELLQLQNPIDVAVADDGRAYVLDKGEKKIVVYDATRKAQKAIRFEDWPLSITIANERLFVTMPPGVVVFDLEGKPVTGYIKAGKKNGEFDKPGGVAVTEDGTMYVADSFNYRVQALKNGKVLWTYGKPLPPDKAIQFNDKSRLFGLPASIAADENGKLYIVDGVNSELVVLSTDGEFLEKVGDVGHDDGTFYYPDGIAYADGKLVVADKFNDRVEVFSVPRQGVAAIFSPSLWWLLALLPLLLLPLLFRRTSYVVTPDFVTAMLADEENAEEVAKALRVAFAAEPYFEAGKEATGELSLKWKSRKIDDEKVAELVESYELRTEEAEALHVVLGKRGKKLLLTEDSRTRYAAQDLDIATANYAELIAGEVDEDEDDTVAPTPGTVDA